MEITLLELKQHAQKLKMQEGLNLEDLESY